LAFLWAAGVEHTHILGYFDRMQFFQFSTLIELLWFSLAIALRTRIKDLEQSRMRALDEMKSQLFKYIFHQTRSPMTLIIGPTESILNSLKEGKKLAAETLDYYLKSIRFNAYKILEGTDQFLDLTKMDEGKMKVRIERLGLKEVLDENLIFAKDAARNKGFAFELSNEADGLELYTDREKLSQIIQNLIKRAFKDVTVGGLVNVLIRKNGAHCVL
ncbi:MAG: histidine kinase dimerization/phospho-acceptor domain-containing protein, partial [Bacteroidota bacterium]